MRTWYWIKTLSGLWWHRKDNRVEHLAFKRGLADANAGRIVKKELRSIKFKDGVILTPPVVPVKWGSDETTN